MKVRGSFFAVWLVNIFLSFFFSVPLFFSTARRPVGVGMGERGYAGSRERVSERCY